MHQRDGASRERFPGTLRAVASLGVAFAAATLLFWPVVGHGRILAIGDGLVEALPAFFASTDRWLSAMFAGFPIYADSSKAFWYPLRLLRFVPNGFNLYVLTAYALSAWAVYGYVRAATGRAIAGIASAATFTCGGFMISHVGHPMIAQPAAWACVAIWSLDTFLRRGQGRWLAATAGAVALSIVAGQPQIAAFTIVLLFAYVLWFGYAGRSAQTLGNYLAGGVAVVLGTAMGAVALLPTIVLSGSSMRSGLDFGTFAAFALPVPHLAQMLTYPFAIGGGAGEIYGSAIVPVQPGLFTEATCYVGLAALALALAGAFARQRLALFWTAVALAGLILAVGDATPVAALLYKVPGFNLFRIPGRHAFELTLAVSVCVGLGVASIAGQRERRFALPVALAVAGSIGLLGTIDVASHDAGYLHEPAVVIFLAAFALEFVLLCGVAATSGAPRLRSAVACAAVLAGSLPFATTAYWRESPDTHVLDRPAYVRLLDRLPLAPGQRIYTAPGNGLKELEPNLPTIWGVPDLGGYTPLQYAAVHILLQTGEDGRLLNVASPLLDLAAVRYFAVPAQPQHVLTATAIYDPIDLQAFLAIGRPEAPRTADFGLTRPQKADRIDLVTALGASVNVPQGAVVATLTVRARSGQSETLPLRAGVETAEFAYERPDVLPLVRHRRAPLFERSGPNSWYVCSLPLHLRGELESVELQMIDADAALNVRKISLVDGAANRAYPFSEEAQYFGDATHFAHIADAGGVAVFENLRTAPPVRIARASPAAVDPTNDVELASFRERVRERRPGDSVFVTGAKVPANDGRGTATLVADENERRRVSLACPRICLLVSSETFTNDWAVAVDGRRDSLVRVDGMFAGVFVSPGHHVVDFRYRPISAPIGAIVSSASGIILILGIGVRRRVRRYASSASNV